MYNNVLQRGEFVVFISATEHLGVQHLKRGRTITNKSNCDQTTFSSTLRDSFKLKDLQLEVYTSICGDAIPINQKTYRAYLKILSFAKTRSSQKSIQTKRSLMIGIFLQFHECNIYIENNIVCTGNEQQIETDIRFARVMHFICYQLTLKQTNHQKLAGFRNSINKTFLGE